MAAMLAGAADAKSGENNLVINPGATVAGLRMEAHARLITSEGTKQLVIHAILINEGSNNVTVLTKEIGPALILDRSGLAVEFGFTGIQHMDGRVMIPSIYPNEPVTLRPNEATMLFARMSSGSFVDPLKGSEEIRVAYSVRDEWGERFDIWHGYVCVNVSFE